MGPFQTATAKIALAPDGIVDVRIAGAVLQTTEDARANLSTAIAACEGRKRPLLIDASRANPLTPEVRRFYSGKLLDDAFLALALLVEAKPLGRMMGNIYLRVGRLGIPTKLFSDEPEARGWLLRVCAHV